MSRVSPCASASRWRGGWPLGLLVSLVVAACVPIDGELLGRRAYFHFHRNAVFDEARDPLALVLPLQLTDLDREELLLMKDEHGELRTVTAINASASAVMSALPAALKGGTVHGTVAYASQIAWDNPEGAGAMRRVRDRLVERLNELKVLPERVYATQDDVPWSAFSVTSFPSEHGSFEWHYDAESALEYRALFVVSGGDDCGEPAVHYRSKDGTVHDLAVQTGHGYLIRGSQTFHSVSGGGCTNADGTPALRHMVGFQISQEPNRRPTPLCYYLLGLGSWWTSAVRFTAKALPTVRGNFRRIAKSIARARVSAS